MSKPYKRLTMDEALVVARDFFRGHCEAALGPDVLDEMKNGFHVISGSVGKGWEEIVGFAIDKRQYYEVELYKGSDACPYVEKVFVRILVSRSREDPACYAIWLPDLEPYDRPFLT